MKIIFNTLKYKLIILLSIIFILTTFCIFNLGLVEKFVIQNFPQQYRYFIEKYNSRNNSSNEEFINRIISNNKTPIFIENKEKLIGLDYLQELEDPENRVKFELGTGYSWKKLDTEWTELKIPDEILNTYEYPPSREDLQRILNSSSMSDLLNSRSDIQKLILNYDLVDKLNLSYSKTYSLVRKNPDLYFGKLDSAGVKNEKKVIEILSKFSNPYLIYQDDINNYSIEYYFDKGIAVIKNSNGEVQSNYLIFKPISKSDVVESDWEKFSVDFSRKALVEQTPAMFGYGTYEQDNKGGEKALWFPNKKKLDDYQASQTK